MGIDVHARTEINTGWSFISNAAVRIGQDTLEVSADTDSVYFNGELDVHFPIVMASRYRVIQNKTTVTTIDEKTGGIGTNPKAVYSIRVGGAGETIIITLFKGLISVSVNAFFHDTEGMLGMHGKRGMIGRNHKMVSNNDANVMGEEWQVNDTEPMLFSVARSPQFPEKCILPANTLQSRRRLNRLRSQNHDFAYQACSGIPDHDMHKFCVDDVLLTGDTDLAHGYIAGTF